MTMIDPTMAMGGPEWAIGGVGGVTDGVNPAPDASGGFGSMLGREIAKVSELQDTAAKASMDLATGSATDVNGVVMAVEQARLSMQLASQVRTKSVEALQDVLRTQV